MEGPRGASTTSSLLVPASPLPGLPLAWPAGIVTAPAVWTATSLEASPKETLALFRGRPASTSTGVSLEPTLAAAGEWDDAADEIFLPRTAVRFTISVRKNQTQSERRKT